MSMGFINELKEHCKINNIPYEYMEELISSSINSENIQAYYLTKGIIPDEQNVLLDALILTNNDVVGISYEIDGDINLLKLLYKDITNISFEIEKNKKYVSIDVSQRAGMPFGWRLKDKIEKKEKLRRFLIEAVKRWKK